MRLTANHVLLGTHRNDKLYTMKIPVHRVVLLESEQQLHTLLCSRKLQREWPTEYRDPIAFILEREIVTVGNLVYAGPVEIQMDSADGLGSEWVFNELTKIEPMRAPRYSSDRWESPRGPEPMGLAAGENRKLAQL